MSMRTTLALVSVMTAFSAPALAATFTPVDLSSWRANSLDRTGQPIGAHSAANWVLGSGSDSVTQTVNNSPSIFADAANSQGQIIRGTMRVNTTSDDDAIGFAFGYDDGELSSADADFYIIDWNQAGQVLTTGDAPGATLAQRTSTTGMALSRVQGDFSVFQSEVDFWSHTGTVTELERAATLGGTGWSDNTTYAFSLLYTADRVKLDIDGVTQFDLTGTFGSGGFGFFGFSQQDVTYAALEVAPVPLPATLPLLLAGLGGLALGRRRPR
jgi:hypothetical protein